MTLGVSARDGTLMKMVNSILYGILLLAFGPKEADSNAAIEIASLSDSCWRIFTTNIWSEIRMQHGAMDLGCT